MVNVEQFMDDYNAMKKVVAVEVEKAQNAVLNLASYGYDNLDGDTMEAMVDILVKKNVGNDVYTALKFYEKYIVTDVPVENNSYSEV